MGFPKHICRKNLCILISNVKHNRYLIILTHMGIFIHKSYSIYYLVSIANQLYYNFQSKYYIAYQNTSFHLNRLSMMFYYRQNINHKDNYMSLSHYILFPYHLQNILNMIEPIIFLGQMSDKGRAFKHIFILHNLLII